MATALTLNTDLTLNVPTDPIIPFIEGDGIGIDIWPAAQAVFDAAVEKSFNGQNAVSWMKVLAGETAFNETGEYKCRTHQPLPQCQSLVRAMRQLGIVRDGRSGYRRTRIAWHVGFRP